MSKQPPVHELEFLRQTNNFRELHRKLEQLGLGHPDLEMFGRHVCGCWLALAAEHIEEAKSAAKAGCKRAVYSRAYYAAYNASKGVRYLVRGWVSLKGDDHGRASVELPDDFPSTAIWAEKITTLYEHRLRADYDNWCDTSTSNTLSPEQAIAEADNFLDDACRYLKDKLGMPQ